MFGKRLIPPIVIVAASVAQAAGPALETCINGGISSTGGQAVRDQACAYLDWQLNAPHYAIWGRGTPQPGSLGMTPGETTGNTHRQPVEGDRPDP